MTLPKFIVCMVEEEDADALINQFPVPADYDGVGSKGTKFVFYL